MKPRKKKCPWCKAWFVPHVRLKRRQISCGKPDCVCKQTDKAKRRWRFKNRLDQRQMVRDWFVSHPDYLKKYRAQHPEYCEQNRQDNRLRRLAGLVDKRKRYFVTHEKISNNRPPGVVDKRNRSSPAGVL